MKRLVGDEPPIQHRRVVAKQRRGLAGDPAGPLELLGFAAADRNAVQGEAGSAQVRTQRQPGLRAARAAGEVEPGRADAERVELPAQFERAGDVAQRADGARPANRNHVRRAAAGADGGLHPAHGLLVEADRQRRVDRRHEVHAGAEQAIEQQVAFVGGRRGVGGQHQFGGHAGDAGGAGGHAGVIRLHRAGGDERRGAGTPGVADQEVELARLVAAAGQPGEVVALDEDARAPRRPAQGLAQPGRVLQRRRQRPPARGAAGGPAPPPRRFGRSFERRYQGVGRAGDRRVGWRGDRERGQQRLQIGRRIGLHLDGGAAAWMTKAHPPGMQRLPLEAGGGAMQARVGNPPADAIRDTRCPRPAASRDRPGGRATGACGR